MVSSWFRRAARALVVLVVLAAPVRAQSLDSGPFRVPEQHPLYSRFLTPRPGSAELLPRGTVEFSLRTRYSNVFEYVRRTETTATFDYERWTNSVEVAWAPVGGLEVGARVATIAGFGGVLDGLVQWYHRRLGLPNGDREDVEDGGFDMTLVRRGDTIVSMPSGAAVTDPGVWAGIPLISGERDAVALRATAKIPIGSESFSNGHADMALQLDGRRAGRHWSVQGGVAVGTLRTDGPLKPFTRDFGVSYHVGVARTLGDTWAALVQVQGSSAYLTDLGTGELNRAPVNLGVGLVGALGDEWRWQAAFTEDVRPNSPAVDFTLDLHLSRRVGAGREVANTTSPADDPVDPPGRSGLASKCAPGPQGGSPPTPSGPCR